MILLDALSIALAAFALYQVTELGKRVKAMEVRKPEPEKRVQAAVVPAQVFLQQIENFTPKKPETLRPNQVRGRDIQGVENVIEFDVKI